MENVYKTQFINMKRERRELKRTNKRSVTGDEVIFIFEKILEGWKTIKIFNTIIQTNPSSLINKKQIETLQAVLAWDTTISSAITKQIEKNMTNKVAAHIIKTSIEKVESKVIGLTGLPTYGDIKNKATSETLIATTGVDVSKEG